MFTAGERVQVRPEHYADHPGLDLAGKSGLVRSTLTEESARRLPIPLAMATFGAMQETRTNRATKTAAGRQAEEDRKVLASLTADERDLVEWAVRNYPSLTVREALDELRAQGI